VAFARDEPLLAYCTKDEIETARPKSFDVDQRLVTGGNEPAGLALSPDATLLAVSLGDRIEVIDLTGKRDRQTLQGQLGHTYALTFTADGKTLVSGSESKTVHEWTIPPRE
jgi:DNA-binding beta-propeller fold protein YncE